MKKKKSHPLCLFLRMRLLKGFLQTRSERRNDCAELFDNDGAKFLSQFFYVGPPQEDIFMITFYGLYFSYLTQYILQIACWASKEQSPLACFDFIYSQISEHTVFIMNQRDDIFILIAEPHLCVFVIQGKYFIQQS